LRLLYVITKEHEISKIQRKVRTRLYKINNHNQSIDHFRFIKSLI